jgi:hypothetical protein
MENSTLITRFRFWLWLIALIGVIGAAQIARRLATRMGGRDAKSRNVAGRMGQPQLENQT